jgi:secreted PhoX family phosphatase
MENRLLVGGALFKAPGFEAIGTPASLRGAAWRFLCSLLFLLVTHWAHSQSYTFTTLAGTPGASGTNDGINQTARFSFPVGVVPDRAGNLYVADFLNHAIRKMTLVGSDWVVSTIAGLPGTPDYADGTNGDARFNRPAGIAMDNSGNLFVAERYNHTIREITPSGTNWVVSTVAGLSLTTGHDDGTNSQARFYLPSGIAVDSSNHLYVADAANFTIREITPSGTNWVVTTIAGAPLIFGFTNGINGEARFNYPYGIAISSAGKLYVADSGNNAIREITPSAGNWVVTTIAGLSGNAGIADGPGSVSAFNFPTGIAVDSTGSLYIADQSNNSIRQITPSASDWIVRTLAGQPQHPGSADGAGTNALFKKPWGLSVDAAGALLVADYSNSTIRQGIAASVPAPDLQILFANNQVILTWPAWASNYVLETSALLTEVNAWFPITNGITLSPGGFVFTTTIDTPSAFYRLRY